MAQLRTHVHVYDDDGKPHIFAPSDDVPDWAAAKITNPGAWESEPVLDATSGEPSEAWTVPQLRAYAEDREIDLADASKKADILAKLRAAGK